MLTFLMFFNACIVTPDMTRGYQKLMLNMQTYKTFFFEVFVLFHIVITQANIEVAIDAKNHIKIFGFAHEELHYRII